MRWAGKVPLSLRFRPNHSPCKETVRRLARMDAVRRLTRRERESVICGTMSNLQIQKEWCGAQFVEVDRSMLNLRRVGQAVLRVRNSTEACARTRHM